jgi:hypothetical protein
VTISDSESIWRDLGRTDHLRCCVNILCTYNIQVYQQIYPMVITY